MDHHADVPIFNVMTHVHSTDATKSNMQSINISLLSVMTKKAIKRGDIRKSRKLSHVTFWLNIVLAVFGAFTYLAIIVIVYIVIREKGASVKIL